MLVGVDETEGAWRGVNIFGNDVVLSDFLQHYDHVLPLVLGLGNQVQAFLWELDFSDASLRLIVGPIIVIIVK